PEARVAPLDFVRARPQPVGGKLEQQPGIFHRALGGLKSVLGMRDTPPKLTQPAVKMGADLMGKNNAAFSKLLLGRQKTANGFMQGLAGPIGAFAGGTSRGIAGPIAGQPGFSGGVAGPLANQAASQADKPGLARGVAGPAGTFSAGAGKGFAGPLANQAVSSPGT